MNAEAYHVAFDVATAELRDIVHQFEQLRIRKEMIEKVVEALEPVISHRDSMAATARQPETPVPLSTPERFDAAMTQLQAAQEAAPIPPIGGAAVGEAADNQGFILHNGVYYAGIQG